MFMRPYSLDVCMRERRACMSVSGVCIWDFYCLQLNSSPPAVSVPDQNRDFFFREACVRVVL